jgi:hypothetical protein
MQVLRSHSRSNASVARETKQTILNEVTDLLGLPRWRMPKDGGSNTRPVKIPMCAPRTDTPRGPIGPTPDVLARAG